MKPALLLSALLFTAIACASMRSAPEITPELLERATLLGLDSAQIPAGRAAFLRECARCHALPDLDETPHQGWEITLAEMGAKTRASATELDALRTFVLSASSGEHPRQ